MIHFPQIGKRLEGEGSVVLAVAAMKSHSKAGFYLWRRL